MFKKVSIIISVLLFITANVFAVGQASTPDPANGAANIPTDKVLTWTAGSGAVSHDVYFGTDSTAVANTNRLFGDLNGDGTVDYKYISIFSGTWLKNNVNLTDY
jgi:hypothetical protein